jgi:hypothetical protein
MSKELDNYLDFSDGALMSGFEYEGKQVIAMPLEEYDKLMKKEKALEIMKLKGEEIYIPAIQKSSDITAYLLRVGAQSTTLTQEEFKVLKEVFE